MSTGGVENSSINKWMHDDKKKYLLKVEKNIDGTESVVAKKKGFVTFFDKLFNPESYDLEKIERASISIDKNSVFYFDKLNKKVKKHNDNIGARIQNHPSVATIFQWKKIDNFSDMGKRFLKQGDYQKALECFLAGSSDDVDPSDLGKCFLKQGDYQKAFDYFSKDPDRNTSVDIQAYEIIAFSKVSQKECPEIPWMEARGIAQLEDPNYQQCGIACTVVSQYYLGKDTQEEREKGLHFLKQAIEYMPQDDTYMQEELVECLKLLQGDEKKEIKGFLDQITDSNGYKQRNLENVEDKNYLAKVFERIRAQLDSDKEETIIDSKEPVDAARVDYSLQEQQNVEISSMSQEKIPENAKEPYLERIERIQKRGDEYLKKQDFENALKYFKGLKDIVTDDIITEDKRIEIEAKYVICLLANPTDKEKSDYIKTTINTGSFDLKDTICFQLVKLEEYERAAVFIQSILSAKPSHLDEQQQLHFQLHLGICLEKQEKYKEAEEALQAFNEYRPDEFSEAFKGTAGVSLAISLLKQGRHAESKAILDRLDAELKGEDTR